MGSSQGSRQRRRKLEDAFFDVLREHDVVPIDGDAQILDRLENDAKRGVGRFDGFQTRIARQDTYGGVRAQGVERALYVGDAAGAYLLGHSGHEWVARSDLPGRMVKIARG